MTASPTNVRDATERRINGLAWLLDNAIRVPFTRWRIGLESILGLVPGVGDAIGGILSTYIVWEGARLGASRITLLRMLANVAIEVVVGFVPLLGDLFDMGWKANTRNVALLHSQFRDAGATTRNSGVWLTLLLLPFLVLAILTTLAGLWLFVQVWHWIA